jgi:uncharacterized membrane protein
MSYRAAISFRNALYVLTMVIHILQLQSYDSYGLCNQIKLIKQAGSPILCMNILMEVFALKFSWLFSGSLASYRDIELK